jgi:DNA-binding transcriptional ArsR family regulator
MPRPPVHFITTPKAWAVYIAPVRLEIVETMRMVAPCSIAELATATDRPADTLYRHIEKLRKVGVVVEAGVRRSGRRFEQVFDLAGDDFRSQFRDSSARAANKMFELSTRSIAKILLRTTRDAAAAEQIVYSTDKRNASVKFEHAWLTPEEFAELRELFVGVKRFMDARKARREGRLYLAAFAAVPVHRKRSARAVAEGRGTGTRTESTANARVKSAAKDRRTTVKSTSTARKPRKLS